MEEFEEFNKYHWSFIVIKDFIMCYHELYCVNVGDIYNISLEDLKNKIKDMSLDEVNNFIKNNTILEDICNVINVFE